MFAIVCFVLMCLVPALALAASPKGRRGAVTSLVAVLALVACFSGVGTASACPPVAVQAFAVAPVAGQSFSVQSFTPTVFSQAVVQQQAVTVQTVPLVTTQAATVFVQSAFVQPSVVVKVQQRGCGILGRRCR